MSLSDNLVAAVIAGVLLWLFISNNGFNSTNDSYSFMLNKHEIVCKSMSQDTCGIGFSNCDNGMTYKCMLNVEMKEIKDEKT
jgi:hypothetical protein